MIFDEVSIGPKSGKPSINLITIPESEIALGFPSFCFPYIPWVDEFGTNSASLSPDSLPDNEIVQTVVPASSPTKRGTTPIPTAPLPNPSNLPRFNPDTHENDQTMTSDSEDEPTLPPANSKESHAPQSQRRSARLETKPAPNYY